MSIAIAVSLKAPDPAAMTALSTLRRISPENSPVRMIRYEHWLFGGDGASRAAVAELVGHYTDIVNPNKQTWSFTGDLGTEVAGEGLIWLPVLVSDRVDSVSENWTSILERSHPGIGPVRYSVLWRLGYADTTPFDEARAKAMAVSLTTHRQSGLLANPVSQEISLLLEPAD